MYIPRYLFIISFSSLYHLFFVSLSSIPVMSKVHRGLNNARFPKGQTNIINIQCVAFIIVYVVRWAGVAQLVYRLAKGWRVRGSIPGGDEILRICPDLSWVPPSPCIMRTGSFPG